MYECIDYVLSNYFSVGAESSEQEAISILHEHMQRDAAFSEEFRIELKAALADESYSWCRVFDEHDVVFFQDEMRARAYAKRILWDSLFETD